jgi:hypothetical protein
MNPFSKKAQTRVFKQKVWKTAYADNLFSKYIRTRDPLCKRDKCGPATDCSHFWKRGDSGTRFDPHNCIGLARKCHVIWEKQKNNEYKDFMVTWLGQEEYDLLEKRARTFLNRRDSVLQWMELYKTL